MHKKDYSTAMGRLERSLTFLAVLALCFCASANFLFAQSCTPPPTNIVSWWPAEGSTQDIIGTNNGAWTGTPGYGAGKVGEAFVLNGSSFVRVPDAANLRFTSALTAEAWINPSSIQENGILVKFNAPGGGTTSAFSFSMNGSGYLYLIVQTNISGAIQATSTSTVPANQWTHVAATYDGSNIKLYINGVLNGQLPLVGSIYQGNADLGIGACCGGVSGGAGVFAGMIDEPAVYNRALTASEIAAIYNAGASGKCSPASSPTISSQPQSVSVYAGQTASFSVTGNGAPTLKYQWLYKNNRIGGATGSTLTLSNVQMASAGNYSVVVSNSYGSVTSSNAVLTVLALPPCTPPDGSIVSWWNAEGTSTDVTGGNNGSWYGTPSYATGEVGQAFHFNGSTFIRVPDAPGLRFTNAMTAEAWVYPYTSGSDSGVMVKYNSYIGNASSGFSFSVNSSGYPYFLINTNNATAAGAVVTAASPAPINQWTHMAGTYDGTNLEIYVNGVLSGTMTAVGRIYPGNADLGIGANCGGVPNGQQVGNFNGLIDEPTLYGSALSATEIAAIYNAGASGKCTGTIAPTISSQPQPVTVYAGANATFTVGAIGSAPLSYQWYFNASPIAGATTTVLNLSGVQSGNGGNYSVVVSNSVGPVTSSNALLTVVPIPSCTAPPAGIAGWWSGESNTVDQVSGNNGSWAGTPAYANGKAGMAFSMNGNNFVRVPDAPSLRFTTGMTAEAWVNPATYRENPILVKYAAYPSTVGCAYSFSIHSSGQFYLTVDTNSLSSSGVTLISSNIVPLNQWTHLAATFDGTALKLYMNGTLVGTAPLTATMYPGTADLGIGATCGGVANGSQTANFAGLIDEPALYDRALSASEIAAIYNAGAGGKCTGTIAPSISFQPQPTTVSAGANASFTVGAAGSAPLSYQWYFNASPIAGATTTILNLSGVQSGNGGNYSVVVSNSVGPVSSSNALLTVNPVPSCTPPPSGIVGWWAGEGNTVDQVSGNNGVWNGGTAIYASGKVGQAFQFGNGTFVRVTDALNLDFTNAMTVEAWVNPASSSSSPASIIVKFASAPTTGGSAFSFSLQNGHPYLAIATNSSGSIAILTSSNTLPLNQWSHVAGTYDGSMLKVYINGVLSGTMPLVATIYPGTTDLGIGACCGNTSYGTGLFSGLIDEPSLYGRALSDSEIAAIYNAGSSGKCTGTIAPTITSEPQSQTVPWGTNVTFTVGAAGSVPLNYQWSFAGTPITGATNTSLALINVQSSASGNYAVVVSNSAGTITSSNSLLTVLPPALPSITGQPQSATAYVGSNVTFSVTATGTAPLSYQWQLGNTPLSGATNASLTLANVQTTDAGSYSVLVSNIAGVVVSSNAVLTILVPTAPTITLQPQSQSVPEGTNITFTVAANGSGNLSYQWLFNGAPLQGATSATLSLAGVEAVNDGSYSVVVSNFVSFATSSNATLSVVTPPCTAPPAGIVSWWSGESNALDQVNGNNGAWNGGNPAYGPGKVGEAFQFNGNGAFVRVTDVPNLDFTNAMTVEAWVNPASFSPAAAILVKFASAPTTGGSVFSFSLQNGHPYLAIVTNSAGATVQLTSSNAVPLNQWSHVAGTYDGSTIKVYINGVLSGTLPMVATIYPGTTDLGIGACCGNTSGGTGLFNGLIDEPAIYGRALSDSEIAAIYSAGGGGKCTGTIAPTITVQPQNQTVGAGSNVTFTVGAGGSAPLAYQWTENSNTISGATNASLTVSNLTMAANGALFSVTVSNQVGSVTSSNAILTVIPPPSVLQIPNLTATSGVVTIPVILVSQGDENTIGFSIDFSTSALSFAGATLDPGTNGTLIVNTNGLPNGQLGLAISLPVDDTFGAGSNVVANLTFNVVPNTNTVVTQIAFGDAPVARQVYDVYGDTLAGIYTNGTLTIPFLGLEGDVFPAPNGDAAVRLNDWLEVGRFVARLDAITTPGEFQRADCAPRSSLGDGKLTVSDWVQAGRYATGLDPLTVAGGPTQSQGNSPQSLRIKQTGGTSFQPLAVSRTLSVAGGVLGAGQTCQLSVQLAAQGDENGVEFSINFPPTVFSYASATAGANASGASLILNTNDLASGTLGVVLALPSGSTFAASNDEVLKLTLNVAGAASGTNTISFGSVPLPKEVSDVTANPVSCTYIPGTFSITPITRPSMSPSAVHGIQPVFAWPSSVSGWVLESTAGLNPAKWTNAVANLVTNAGVVTATGTTNNPQIYYRLRHP